MLARFLYGVDLYMFSSKRKEALGKFLNNFVLLYLGAGVASKFFSGENLNIRRLVFTLLIAFVFLTMGVFLHPKE